MSDPGSPPVSNASPDPEPKKGLSPLAWIGIGCGGLVLLGIIAMTVLGVNSTGRRNTSMMRCCDAETETEKVRPGGSACDAFAWSAAGRGA